MVSVRKTVAASSSLQDFQKSYIFRVSYYVLKLLSLSTFKFVHREGGSQVYLLITGDSTGLSLRLNGRNSCTSVLPELVSYLSTRIDRAVI